MESELEKVESFFKSDLKIKELINKPINNDPHYDITLNFEKSIRYSLEEIEKEFNKIIKYAGLNEKIIEKKFKAYQISLDKCGFNLGKLKNFYLSCFVNMSEKVLNDTKKECKGYYFLSNPNRVLEESTSINEMLHLIHSYIVNSEYLYQGINKIAEKKYTNDYPITLYGKENEISKNIFENLPIDSENGITDILSLDKKTIMMIRDRGHALSFEIEEENDKVFVKYFIPKICNVEMVNNLKGVQKVKDDSVGTFGEFLTNKENVGNDITEFIEKVPTDSDMPKFHK